jgi:hypothetical protein
MYKQGSYIAQPLIEPPPPETVVVNNADEQKQEESKGYTTEVPKPKQPGDQLKQHQAQSGSGTQPTEPPPQ